MSKFDDILKKARAEVLDDIYEKVEKVVKVDEVKKTTAPKKGRGRPKMDDKDKLKKRSIYANWDDMDSLADEFGIDTHVLIKELLNISLRDLGKVETVMTPFERGVRAEIKERKK